jgi:molybdopterin-guanine dinucleotide biosynthesis protein A
MGGRNKAFLELDGRSFLDRIVKALDRCFDRLLLVTRQPELYRRVPGEIVEDILDVRSPLTGIHAGLVNMDTDFGFFTSCDNPLLKPELVRMLVNEIEPDIDIVVPSSGSYFQPLCAVYSKRCVPLIENRLGRGEVKADGVFDSLGVKKIAYERLQAVDPALESFFNVNTPEDLKTAEQALQRGGALR